MLLSDLVILLKWQATGFIHFVMKSGLIRLQRRLRKLLCTQASDKSESKQCEMYFHNLKRNKSALLISRKVSLQCSGGTPMCSNGWHTVPFCNFRSTVGRAYEPVLSPYRLVSYIYPQLSTLSTIESRRIGDVPVCCRGTERSHSQKMRHVRYTEGEPIYRKL